MQEPWDELMGPSADDLKNMLHDNNNNQARSPPPVRRSGGGAPPAGLFKSSSKRSPSTDPVAIRQEAMKVLEEANSGYPKKETGSSSSKRSALKGLSFTANRTRKYRDDDDDNNNMDAMPPSREELEYADEAVVDVVGMERRSLSTQAAKTESKWSSRYSVNKTLLAMSGGAQKKPAATNTMLDRMDRKARDNVIGSTKAPKVFGSGFSFRQKNVFGQQNVVSQLSQNLRTLYTDDSPAAATSMPPANPRSKSWQEQLDAKMRQKRRYIAGVVGLVLALVAVSVGVHRHRLHHHKKSQESVTFYIAQGDPTYLPFEHMSNQASFLVHLGNLDPNAYCSEPFYEESRYLFLDGSPVPTFVLPGPYDIDFCQARDEALDEWLDNFHLFHREFGDAADNLHTMVEGEMNENFSFVREGVLFMGVHLGDDEDLVLGSTAWIEGMTDKFKGQVRAIVIFGAFSEDEPFVEDMASFLTDNFAGPVAYIYPAEDEGPDFINKPFDNDHFTTIELGFDSESDFSPLLRLNVGFGENPFIVG